MNIQRGKNGIEWTDATWNPVGGCHHACRWEMPDGSIAKCYAEEIAEGLASAAYPKGFAHHYWRPDKLDEPGKLQEPSRIFLDSMSDLMGHWVPEEQIRAVLEVVWNTPRHTFQLLTKNAPRLLKFKRDLPPNLWIGVSAPPTMMLDNRLHEGQQVRYVHRALDVMAELDDHLVVWWSFEPLSWDIAEELHAWRYVNHKPLPFGWAVIGAASNGRMKYQPDSLHVEYLLNQLDADDIPVFFKGNLEWEPWREEWPRGT